MDFRGDGIKPFLPEILEELAFDNESELWYFLERYKYFTRDECVEHHSDRCDTVVSSLESLKRESRFNRIEEKYGVLVGVDEDDVLIVYDCTKAVQAKSIELEFHFSQSLPVFIGVTPLNFETLAGRTPKQLEPSQMFNRILAEAILTKATDIHFEVQHLENRVTYPVRFRINGVLRECSVFELSFHDNQKIISHLIANKTDANAMDLLDSAGVTTSARAVMNGIELDLRIAANRARDGYHCVIRIQQKTTVSLRVHELGFSNEVQKALYHVSKKQSGITFITGAIRTGKNTTAFAIANEICNKPIKVASYESPIEVLMPFTQVDYKEDTDVLLHAIRLSKKQDVNVAFINEIPTKDVAFAVQDLVNSSIHVITTMHMNRIWHLPYKLKEYYGEAYKDIISQINAVFNQKMFSKPCPHCMESMLVSSIDEDGVKELLVSRGVSAVGVSIGCDRCRFTGVAYGSNQPYSEFIIFNDTLISELLMCNSPSEMEKVLRRTAKDNSLERFMVEAVADGKLSYKDLISIV